MSSDTWYLMQITRPVTTLCRSCDALATLWLMQSLMVRGHYCAVCGVQALRVKRSDLKGQTKEPDNAI